MVPMILTIFKLNLTKIHVKHSKQGTVLATK